MDNIKQLMENRHRTTYVRITALTKDEIPIETIEGTITGGSISVDGASAVRRTCNLTLVSQNTIISEPNWAIKNKFKLEIGILNIHMNEITWFKQGVYGITNFSLSYGTAGINISIQGKDKMGYLDGTFGGIITAQTDFATWDEIDTEGNIINRKVLIHDIIRNIVHQFALEPYHNIFISGLNTAGYELWDYRGDQLYPIYYFYNAEGTAVVNITLDGNLIITDTSTGNKVALKDIPEDNLYQYALMQSGNIFSYSGINYKIAKIEHGEAAGYHKTDLIYSGELIALPGETVVSVLDKIKDFLGMFEYFYDLDGHFVFQQKTSSVEGAIRPLNTSNVIASTSNDKYSYVFEDESLITQISSSPDISNIKNDIIVWGKKPISTNNTTPIHARFAIAHKPTKYIPMEKYEGIQLTYLGEVSPEEGEQCYYKDTNSYNYYKVRYSSTLATGLIESPLSTGSTGIVYQKKSDGYYYLPEDLKIYKRIPNKGFEIVAIKQGMDLIDDYYILKSDIATTAMTIENYDWREILYQMTLDYFQHGEFAYYSYRLMQQGYHNGKTGYEPFYTDMQAFWRLLYDPSTPISYSQVGSNTADYCNISVKTKNITELDKINGYTLESVTINQSAENTIFYYLKPNQSESPSKLYFINTEPFQMSQFGEEINAFKNNNIAILKDIKVFPTTYEDILKNSYQYTIKYYQKIEEYYKEGNNKYWNKTAVLAPEDLIFWIDFLDTSGPVGEYSIQEIGTRSVVENADNIKSIYQRKPPEVEFIVYSQIKSSALSNMRLLSSDDYTLQDSKDQYLSPKIDFNATVEENGLLLKKIQISQDLASTFTISSQGLSAADRIDELVYKHVCSTEGVNISAIPLYHLEPNTLIYINSEETGVKGEYLINSFTVPLIYNGTMSIMATKVVKRLK